MVAYVAIDRFGEEVISDVEPKKDKRGYLYHHLGEYDCPTCKGFIFVPEGTIKMITGMDLKYEDGPRKINVSIEEE